LVSPLLGLCHYDKNIFNSKEQTIFSDFTLQKWFANLNYFFFLNLNRLTFFKIICYWFWFCIFPSVFLTPLRSDLSLLRKF